MWPSWQSAEKAIRHLRVNGESVHPIPITLLLATAMSKARAGIPTNPVLTWCTQNHVKNYEGGRSYLWLGLSLSGRHLPGFSLGLILINPSLLGSTLRTMSGRAVGNDHCCDITKRPSNPPPQYKGDSLVSQPTALMSGMARCKLKTAFRTQTEKRSARKRLKNIPALGIC